MAVAVRAGNRDHEMKARHNLGYAEFLAGRIPRALAAMDRAEALNEGSRNPIGLLDQARVLREAGLASDADRLLATRGRAVHRAAAPAGRRRRRELALAECLLVEGEPGRALRLARSAERTFARRGNPWWERQAQMLRAALRARRSPPGCEPVAARARALAACLPRGGPRRPGRVGRAARRRVRAAVGSRPGRRRAVLPAVREADPLQSRLQSREVRALAAMARGEHGAGSRRGAPRARRAGLLHVNRFGSLDLRTASAVHGVLAGQARPRARGAQRQPRRALRGRRAWSGDLHPAGARRAARPTRGPRSCSASCAGARRRCGTGGRPRRGDALARLRGRGLQRDIRARAWELEGGDERAQPPGAHGWARSVRRPVELGTAFVTYVVHRGRWLAVVASGRRAVALDLAGTAEVDELVQRVRADLDALAMPLLPPPLVDAVRRSLDAGLRRLDDLLLGPARRRRARRWWSRAARRWRCCRGACCPRGGGCPWWSRPGRPPGCGSVPRRAVPVRGWWRWPGRGCTGPRTRRTAWRLAGPASSVLTGGGGHDRSRAPGAGRAPTWSTWPRTAPTSRRARCSPRCGSPTARSTPTSWTPTCGGRRAWCCRPARRGWRPCVPGDEGLGLTSVLLHLGSRSVLAGVARVRRRRGRAGDGEGAPGSMVGRHRQRRTPWPPRWPRSRSRRRSWRSARPGDRGVGS